MSSRAPLCGDTELNPYATVAPKNVYSPTVTVPDQMWRRVPKLGASQLAAERVTLTV